MKPTSVLVFFAPARRRDDIVDALMGLDAVSGFSFSDGGGFSRQHSHLNQQEQVQGFGDYERFEVLCDDETVRKILSQLASIAGRDHIRYWVTPVSTQGQIGGAG
jgi:hypothetical protein